MSAIDCFNIFYKLHRLSLAASSHWISRVNRVTLSNLLYETEFVVLSVPDHSREFLSFDIENKDEQDEDYDQRKSTADAASVVEGLLTATQIFIYAALREIPRKVKIFTILLERLHIATKRPHISTTTVWKREKNLSMLVWVLVVACSVAPAGEQRAIWMSMLAETMNEELILTQEDLKAALKRVVWTDTYFNPVLNGIWDELRRLRSAKRTANGETKVEQPVTHVIDPLFFESHMDNDVIGWGYGDDRFSAPMNFEEGRWKVNGWYV